MLEERVSDCETMRRENRRVAAMSWGAGDDLPPPKPSRIPPIDSSSTLSLGENSACPQTYIIAQNAAVLAQLMRENENRPLNPSAYSTPASVFNTLGVDIDIDASSTDPSLNETPLLPLRTVMLPASELLKLNPLIDDNSHLNTNIPTNNTNPDNETTTFTAQRGNSHENAHIPSCERVDARKDQIDLIERPYKLQRNLNISQDKLYSTNHPIHIRDSVQKSMNFDGNGQLSTYATRFGHVDQDVVHPKPTRSNSLTKQFSPSNENMYICSESTNTYMANIRSSSLERGTCSDIANQCFKLKALDSGNNKQGCAQNVQYRTNNSFQGGSLERKQSIANSFNMAKQRNFPCGSLERNQQGIYKTYFYVQKSTRIAFH